jgi:signal peptidase I
MERTLQNNDRLIILKVPRTWARITKHSYIPPRGDIVVFIKRGLSEFGESGDKQLIKRVIGLPGERVIVRDGKITIYNKEHPNGFDPDANAPWGGNISTTSGNVDLVVPEGELFVCGDNRANSLDSRIFGTIPANDVVGKLSLRMLPISKVEAF